MIEIYNNIMIEKYRQKPSHENLSSQHQVIEMGANVTQHQQSIFSTKSPSFVEISFHRVFSAANEWKKNNFSKAPFSRLGKIKTAVYLLCAKNFFFLQPLHCLLFRSRGENYANADIRHSLEFGLSLHFWPSHSEQTAKEHHHQHR